MIDPCATCGYTAFQFYSNGKLVCRKCHPREKTESAAQLFPEDTEIQLVQADEVISKQVSVSQRRIAVGIAALVVIIVGLMGRGAVVEYNKMREAAISEQIDCAFAAEIASRYDPEQWTRLGTEYAYRESEVSVCIIQFVPGGVEVIDYIVKDE